MKNRLWTIPFLLFSVTLIASINQPTTNVSANSQDTSSVTANNSETTSISNSKDVVKLASTYGTSAAYGNLYTGGTSDDRYPLYFDDGSQLSSDADISTGINKMIDNIIINADTGVVYYGIYSGYHLDTDNFYMKFDSAKMTFESNKKPVKITLNFYDTTDSTKTIQTRTVDTGFDAGTPLFDAAMSGLKALNVQLKGYTLDSKTPTTSTSDTAAQTATVNYHYTKDPDTSTPSDHPGTKTSGNTGSTSNNVSTTSNTSSTTPATTTSSSASLTTSGAADQADTTKVSAVKGSAVYATKKIALYNKPTFTKATRAHWYAKQTRPNRPQFVVTGYARSNAGRLRYRVRSLDGRTGYITANANFVRNTYYHTNPKTIRVIGNHGLNAYHKVNLSGKVRHYKRGTTLKIKRIEKHNLTTRLVLTNGTYITGNKTLVIKK
ncbi:DUF5776 domain-containing protein [Levilactobacillus wangkuiensis]|uniref:DUF5776 domain-containing protein n=1 Tax=Levilactobacillus wangkuiensis TaxID=2799566 RepID=UPI0019442DD2|nr:DUF5776 domain-containing protein [Levilactobacillus wangkuiensis]